jgi:hypothetical protein
MWVGRPTYERAVALVIGFDMAQPESVDGPLQSRIAARHDTGPLGWPWVLTYTRGTPWPAASSAASPAPSRSAVK